MALSLIIDPSLAPVFLPLYPIFSSSDELHAAVNKLDETQAAQVNAMLDAYGFEPKEHAEGDPRKLLSLEQLPEYLGFHNGKFGFISELEIAYLANEDSSGDSQYLNDAEIKRLHQALSDKFDAEPFHQLKKYDKTDVFFTYHSGNYDHGLCLVAFTPLVANGVTYSSPYSGDNALHDLTEAIIDFSAHGIKNH
ncbi:hypothetical protein DDO73_11940 [Vibrio cholerae]|uniref:hypothetical protein n=1 Tax=Vibrio cholerae TaxID=666 RepID=UPI000E64D2F8|nr:hypothetical protein [Vibrio cholerae]EGR4073759.1 hypothetical protein [Vibrio cholerae]MBY4641993.1 hypothetical protein [Vibrio cholerae]MCR9658265.1 hypothetical protein [Vibrio cholerae]MCR9688946.1 hypothetical protein [Vibrio cholerae]MCR9737454.1 hypothetical protein [Vibrio cholerae]